MPEKQYKDWNPDQPFLLPPSLQEWLPEDHPVYMMLDILEELDVSAIEEKYRQKDSRGTRPYAPKMMVGLLLYGYSVGIRSSRKLEKATYEDIPFRVLAAGNHPDHSRISEFRRKHLEELEDLFLQVFQICQRMGLVELGNVALDGTKVQASASKHKAMSYERMLEEEERLKEEIQEMLEEAEATDREEDERFGRENRGDELPEELKRRKDRLATIQEAKRGRAEEVQAKADRAAGRAQTHESERERKRSGTLAEKWDREAEQLREEAAGQVGEDPPEAETPEGMPKHRPKTETDGTPKPKAQRNFTDPDSRIMEKGGEFLQGYNCQLLVDGAHQIIVAQGGPTTPRKTVTLAQWSRKGPTMPRRLQRRCWPIPDTGTRMPPKRPISWELRPTSQPSASRTEKRRRLGQESLPTRSQLRRRWAISSGPAKDSTDMLCVSRSSSRSMDKLRRLADSVGSDCAGMIPIT